MKTPADEMMAGPGPEEQLDETAPAPEPAMGTIGAEDCVPLSALSMPDESEQMQNPEIGDPVQYTVEGKVSRIEGDQAYVTREAINGQPINPEASETSESGPGEPDGDEAEYSQLEDMAKNTQLQ